MDTDCSGPSSCVAGRCLPKGANPAIANARRLLYAPVDVACVRRAGSSEADVATLGRGDGALVLLRFQVPLLPETSVLEAYVVVQRVTEVDSDPTPILLHAARVIDRWDGASVSWARQPRVQEVGAPVTRVLPSSGPHVRIDVRALVERWRRRRDDADGGIAILVEGESATGMTFALAPASGGPGRSAELDVPRLELYVK